MSGAPDDFGKTRMFHTASPGNIGRRLAARKYHLRKAATQKRVPKPKAAAKPTRPSKKDQVAELLSEEKGIEEIAECVGISVKAVRRHIEKIRDDLGLRAR